MEKESKSRDSKRRRPTKGMDRGGRTKRKRVTEGPLKTSGEHIMHRLNKGGVCEPYRNLKGSKRRMKKGRREEGGRR